MKICDAHNDFLTEIKNNKDRIEYINKINKNKDIKKVCAVIWTSKFKNPIKFIIKIKKNVLDKVNCKKLIICLEDLGFINKQNLEYATNFLIKLKPFSCGLTWNFDNTLGGGAYGKRGLSKLGIKVIKKLEKNNIIIDTAHMNNKTFNDFINITKKPIYNSHSNIFCLYQHKRNLNTYKIKKICSSNGLFCLSFVSKFISNKEITSEDVANQIVYFVRKFGCKNLAIGTDFNGTKNLPVDLKDYINFDALKNFLIRKGVKIKTINKVFYKNFLEFYNKITS